MVEPKKEIPINADEMESLLLKYMKKHKVRRKEAERMIWCNGFKEPKRLGEIETPPNNP